MSEYRQKSSVTVPSLKNELAELKRELASLDVSRYLSPAPQRSSYAEWDDMFFKKMLLIGGAFVLGLVLGYLFFSGTCKR